jgi:hypothetical protein
VRIRHVPLLLTLLVGAACYAQSNGQVDALLMQSAARTDSVAYMVFVANGSLQEDATPAQALDLLVSKGWLGKINDGATPIHLDSYCFLVMKSLDLKGGLMYSLFPSPRYAYRELAAKGLVNTSGGPMRSMPGDEALKVLRQAMELKGGAR